MAFKGTLRPFQQEGLDAMIKRGRLLLAFHMGLGKTVVSIAALEHLFEEEKINSGLIVTPVSMKYHWADHFERFTDGASVGVVDGTPTKRRKQYDKALAGGYDYIILNYEQVVNDWEFVSELPRDFVVCDEVTAIKHFRAKRSRKMKQLQAPYLFGLTGQPIENRPEEAYSIMQWIDSDLFGRFDIFDRTFIVRNSWGAVKYYKNLPTFKHTMEQAMVRKTLREVADQLPERVEKNIYVEFAETPSKNLYRKVAHDLVDEITAAMDEFGPTFDLGAHYGADASGKELAVRGAIASKMMCLRMFCDHPDLVRISADAYGKPQRSSAQTGSVYAHYLQQSGLLDAKFKAPKLDTTAGLIEDILSEDPVNKVVLFSFFKPMLRLLQERCAASSRVMFDSVLYTGDMNAQQKETAKKQFQYDPSTRLFLSSDAGGYGLDLPQANYLINYDQPWSAGKLDQRNARIFRLSSEFGTCTILNMLMHGSIDERQYDMNDMKRRIAAAFLDGEGVDNKGSLHNDLSSLREFLASTEV